MRGTPVVISYISDMLHNFSKNRLQSLRLVILQILQSEYFSENFRMPTLMLFSLLHVYPPATYGSLRKFELVMLKVTSLKMSFHKFWFCISFHIVFVSKKSYLNLTSAPSEQLFKVSN